MSPNPFDKRPPAIEVLQAAEHWLIESVAAYASESNWDGMGKAAMMLKVMREQFPQLVAIQEKNPLSLTPEEMQTAMHTAGGVGNKINAIKLLRARIGCGLKQAKYFIEAYLQANGIHGQLPPDAGPEWNWVAKTGEVPIGWTLPNI